MNGKEEEIIYFQELAPLLNSEPPFPPLSDIAAKTCLSLQNLKQRKCTPNDIKGFTL